MRKLEGLIPTLKAFNGTNPLMLIRYFAELRHGFDDLGVPEAAEVRGLHLLLEGEAKNFYEPFAARGTLPQRVVADSRVPRIPSAPCSILDGFRIAESP